MALVDCAQREMASAWESLDEIQDPNLPEDLRNRFAGVWETHRSIFGYSLLAELPFRLLRALEDHPELDIGEWDYLVVDEYQDLNKCDLSVLKQITEKGPALIGAGDDDQSIYRFRRALPLGIQQFVSTDYPGSADYTLSISQRCATSVLAWARHVIEGLPGRPPRPALKAAPHCVVGESKYLAFATWPAEVSGVTQLVKWLIDMRGVVPEDIAIMFRSKL